MVPGRGIVDSPLYNEDLELGYLIPQPTKEVAS
jgi:hypothetical protein